MKITAYIVSEELELKPARPSREWMDKSINKNPYRCLPLIMANNYGWELLSKSELTAEWDGGQKTDSIKIEKISGTCYPISHFGEGVLTWHTGYLFTTEFPYGLYVTGSPNQPNHNIIELSGIVESYWLPFPFTMNWKFTAPGKIKIQKGDVIAQIFPIQVDLFSQVQAEIKPIQSNPELYSKYNVWRDSRSKFNAGPRDKKDWQKNYFRGVDMDRNTIDNHITNPNVPDFKKST